MLAWFREIFDEFGSWLLEVLPTSPFRGWLDSFRGRFFPFLGYLNYFVPIRDFINILGAFLAVVAVFYLYSIIMRWVKML